MSIKLNQSSYEVLERFNVPHNVEYNLVELQYYPFQQLFHIVFFKEKKEIRFYSYTELAKAKSDLSTVLSTTRAI